MTKTDFENLYRFIACISAGKEYFNSVREPLTKMHRAMLEKKIEGKYPPTARRMRRMAAKVIELEMTKFKTSISRFEKRIEAVICEFDLSDDVRDQEMLDTMIDKVTDFMSTLEIEIKD